MKNRLASFILVVALIVLNVFFIYPLFQGEFTSFPLSIESVFLAEAKFVVGNFPNLLWYPFWYFGLPFYLVYQPIPIFLTALFSLLPNISIGQSYRILTGLFLILGGLGVYFWAKYITKNKLAAVAGAVSFAIMPSVAFLFLAPSWRGFGLIPLKLVNALVYGEGPHMWGLALVPFACLFYQKLLRKPEIKINWIAAVFLVSAVFLTNLTAFVGLLVFFFFIFWLEGSLRHLGRKLLASLVVGAFVFGLSLFWYNLEFLSAAFDYSLGEGGGIFSGVWGNIVFAFFTLFAFLGVLNLSYRLLYLKLGKRAFLLVLPTTLFIFLFVVIYGWFAWDVAVFPLPFRTIPRLIPELELAFAMLLATIINSFPKKLGYLLAGASVFVFIYVGWGQRDKFLYIISPHQNFSKTSEFVVAEKLQQLGARRVYATGTNAFWQNMFTDVGQLRGGKGGDFGGLNPWWAHLSYFINRGEAENANELTEKWLRVLGLEYIVVNYPGSGVYYHDFDNLTRFSKYEEVFDYGGDKILRLPTRNTSIALALPSGWADRIEKVEDLSSGRIVLNEERLNNYFSFVEEQAKELKVEYPYRNNWSKIRIIGNQLEESDEILIRQTYYPGWKAKSNGKKLKLAADPIGFTRIINPGSSEIILRFSPTPDLISSYILSLVSMVAFVVFFRKEWYQKV